MLKDNVNRQIKRLTHLERKLKLFMAKGPAYHYTYGRWRLNRWLNSWLAKVQALNDQMFLAQFDLEEPGLSRVKKAVLAGDYLDAQTHLRTYFQARTTPYFFFEPGEITHICSLIDPDERDITIRRAGEICQNIFCFRRVGPVKFEDGIDWTYRPQGNIDWTWDLNRHTYFETLGRAYWYTGDEQYAQKFQELLLDWLAKNPVSLKQPNWASVFEVAFRINTWIWAFYYFRAAAAFDDKTCLALLNGLLTHGHYLDTFLELHVQNNHLLLEAKALAMLGLLFPEFKLAKKWRHRGLRILYQQIQAQVCSDGVHGELATHYHRVISGELVELLVLLENNETPIPPEILATFNQMVEFELWITKPNSLPPLFGDSALEDTHLRFSAASSGLAFLGRSDLKAMAPPLDAADIWLLGYKRVRQYLDLPATPGCLPSRAFPEGGYFVMRSGQGSVASYLAFDCGPFGYKPAPNHGHADALSFELHALGQTLLLDPGVYSTHLGWDWRRFFRSSRAHNTVVVDDQDQSILLDSRRVYRPAQATLHQWISSEYFDFVDGSHNGYERLSEPVTHRRQIFFVKPEYWVVIDMLTGQGKHCFDLYFHLMPGINPQLELSSGYLRTGNGLEPGLAIVPLATGDLQPEVITGTTNPIQGWVSFFSGKKLPASTLRYRQEGVAPIQFCTALYPYPAGQNASITISAINLEIEQRLPTDQSNLTSLCIETQAHIDYLIVDRGLVGAHKFFAGYESDAQLLFVRHRKEENKLVKVMTRGGRRLLYQGHSLFETNGWTKDLIFDCELQKQD